MIRIIIDAVRLDLDFVIRLFHTGRHRDSIRSAFQKCKFSVYIGVVSTKCSADHKKLIVFPEFIRLKYFHFRRSALRCISIGGDLIIDCETAFICECRALILRAGPRTCSVFDISPVCGICYGNINAMRFPVVIAIKSRNRGIDDPFDRHFLRIRGKDCLICFDANLIGTGTETGNILAIPGDPSFRTVFLVLHLTRDTDEFPVIIV